MATCNYAVALAHSADPRAAETGRSALRLCAQTSAPLDRDLWSLSRQRARPKGRYVLPALLGAAETELQGARLSPVEAVLFEAATNVSREALGSGAFDQAREEGRLLTHDAAVELGLRPVAVAVDLS